MEQSQMEAIVPDYYVPNIFALVEQNTKYNSVTGPLLHLDMSSIGVLPENGQSRLQ
jgi:hypothetical protein